ncbi:MAG: hypothetical protein LKE96_10345 [Acetobacter peroxydans]|jgi:hypothetical protein|nr:hypothetical protein [Acetobacter peroxydans]
MTTFNDMPEGPTVPDFLVHKPLPRLEGSHNGLGPVTLYGFDTDAGRPFPVYLLSLFRWLNGDMTPFLTGSLKPIRAHVLAVCEKVLAEGGSPMVMVVADLFVMLIQGKTEDEGILAPMPALATDSPRSAAAEHYRAMIDHGCWVEWFISQWNEIKGGV